MLLSSIILNFTVCMAVYIYIYALHYVSIACFLFFTDMYLIYYYCSNFIEGRCIVISLQFDKHDSILQVVGHLTHLPTIMS